MEDERLTFTVKMRESRWWFVGDRDPAMAHRRQRAGDHRENDFFVSLRNYQEFLENFNIFPVKERKSRTQKNAKGLYERREAMKNTRTSRRRKFLQNSLPEKKGWKWERPGDGSSEMEIGDGSSATESRRSPWRNACSLWNDGREVVAKTKCGFAFWKKGLHHFGVVINWAALAHYHVTRRGLQLITLIIFPLYYI